MDSCYLTWTVNYSPRREGERQNDEALHPNSRDTQLACGRLNWGLSPLIFILTSIFFIGEVFYSVPLFLLEMVPRLSGMWQGQTTNSWWKPWKAHIFLNLWFCLVIINLNLIMLFFFKMLLDSSWLFAF